MPRAMSYSTVQPRSSTSLGSRVPGAITRTSPAPSTFRARIWERATRECSTSPTMATFRPSKLPLCWRMVSMSSMAWVGWAWRPSPALMMATPGVTLSAIKCGAPLWEWRTTNMSLAMASRLSRVSDRDSPLEVAEVLISRFSTSADNRLAASSKVLRVRVLDSKNRLTTVRPRSRGTFLIRRSPTSMNESAVSRMPVSSSRPRPSRVRKCRN